MGRVRVERTRGRIGPAWLPIVVGAGFLLVSTCGAPLFAISEAVLRAASPGAPRDPVFGILLAAFPLIGLGLVAYGIFATVRARRRRSAPRSAAAPWLSDHGWRRDGIAEDGTTGAALYLTFAGALVVGVAGALAASYRTPAAYVMAAMFGIPSVAAVVAGTYLSVRAWRHGTSELRFGRFPFMLGGPLEVTLVRPGGAPPLRAVEATLSCVQERVTVEHGAGRSRGTTLVRDVAWRETKGFPALGPGGLRFAIRFDLPPHLALETALSAQPARYWELEVHAPDEGGADYGATFLVPVYGDPSVARPPPFASYAGGAARTSTRAS